MTAGRKTADLTQSCKTKPQTRRTARPDTDSMSDPKAIWKGSRRASRSPRTRRRAVTGSRMLPMRAASSRPLMSLKQVLAKWPVKRRGTKAQSHDCGWCAFLCRVA